MLRGRLHLLLSCLFASAALLVLPASAAAVVQVTVGSYDLPDPMATDPVEALLVLGTNGVDDQVTATVDLGSSLLRTDDELHITSSSGLIDDAGGPGGACDLAVDGTTMVCELAAITDDVWIFSGGGGDDDLRLEGPAVAYAQTWMFGGLGDDVLRGGSGVQRMYGEDGLGGGTCDDDPAPAAPGEDDCDDTFHDGLGNDLVFGEGGSDLVVQPALAGSAGTADEDDVDLGAGSADAVSYAARPSSEAVIVRIGGVDGIDTDPSELLDASGVIGEEDDLHSGIERVTGTAGTDTFRTTASAVALVLDGAAGSDTFLASPATERFIGGSGTDTVSWMDAGFAYDGVMATADGVANDGDGEGDDVSSDIEHIIGSPGADTIAGAATSGCRIAGGAGADVLTAGSAGCILEGGNGADDLVGGAGNDTLRPGASGTATADDVTFGGGSDTADYASASLVGSDSPVVGVQASANPGVTNWCYGLGTGTTSAKKSVGGQQHLDHYDDAPETILGTIVTDTLCGGPAGTRLEGGAGADVLVGSSGADVIIGGLGNDLLNGQAGVDTLDGGDGDDNLNGGAGNDLVDGGPGNDPHVRGGGGSDVIRGGTGDDVLDEASFSAIEQGQPGEELDSGDVLEGGPGIDTLDGALGDDVVTCTAETILDTWSDSGDGTETFDCSGLGQAMNYAAGAGIDVLVGSALGDTLSGAATIDGGAGDDRLTAASVGSTIRGGPGNDTIVGSDSADVLGGGDGADSIDARGGDDVLDGGFGGDVLSGGAGAEVLSYETRASGVAVSLDGIANDGTAGEGDNVQDDVEELVGTAFADTLTAGASATNLIGGGGDDVLVGSPAAELLQGGAGADRLVGGAGANVLEGGAGDDTLLGGRDADRLDGGDDHDVLDGGAGTDAFVGGSGRDAVSYATRTRPVVVTLGDRKANDGEAREKEDVPLDVENVVGGRGKDRLVGNNLGNSLRGGAGNDTLLGGAGNDVLYGGAGNDALTGGRGNDKHYGEAGNDTLDAKDTVLRDRRLREVVDGGAGRDIGIIDVSDRIVRIEFKGTMVKVKVRGRTILRLQVARITAKRATNRVARAVAAPSRRA